MRESGLLSRTADFSFDAVLPGFFLLQRAGWRSFWNQPPQQMTFPHHQS
jgi:hypothetical protein